MLPDHPLFLPVTGAVALLLFLLLLRVIIRMAVIRARLRRNAVYRYKRRGSLVTRREMLFYRELLPVARRRNLTLFSKVRLADLIEPEPVGDNWQAHFNKIKAKHIDFVFCDSEELLPVLALEVDDATHDRPDRQERDRFVDHALRSAGIAILHVRETGGLSRRVEEALKKGNRDL